MLRQISQSFILINGYKISIKHYIFMTKWCLSMTILPFELISRKSHVLQQQ